MSKTIEQVNEQLKSCPFCGREATVKIDPFGEKDTDGRRWMFTVSCNSCCASTGVCWSIEMAAELWNRRISDEQIH